MPPPLDARRTRERRPKRYVLPLRRPIIFGRSFTRRAARASGPFSATRAAADPRREPDERRRFDQDCRAVKMERHRRLLAASKEAHDAHDARVLEAHAVSLLARLDRRGRATDSSPRFKRRPLLIRHTTS